MNLSHELVRASAELVGLIFLLALLLLAALACLVHRESR
jgi:hypothetical protein